MPRNVTIHGNFQDFRRVRFNSKSSASGVDLRTHCRAQAPVFWYRLHVVLS